MKICHFPKLLTYQTEVRDLLREQSDISVVCSDLNYGLAASAAIGMENNTILIQEENSFAMFTLTHEMGGTFLLPLELFWMFGSHLFAHTLQDMEHLIKTILEFPGLTALRLSGLNAHHMHLIQKLASLQAFRLYRHEPTRSVIVDIIGGIEGLFFRVSSNKRKNLRKALRKREMAALAFDYSNTQIVPEVLWQRILSLEQQSWKFKKNESVFQSEELYKLYQELIFRYASRKELHALFVQLEGEDIAYIFGVGVNNTFRGFQTSYLDRPDVMELEAGTNAHLYLIDALAQQGFCIYDMGMEVPYKTSWSSHILETQNVSLEVRKA